MAKKNYNLHHKNLNSLLDQVAEIMGEEFYNTLLIALVKQENEFRKESYNKGYTFGIQTGSSGDY